MYNESQKKATAKYMRENLDDIKIRVKKGERERYKSLAARLGISVNQLFIQAVEQFISDHIDELGDAPNDDTPINQN